jgi:hypothetical protein
VSSQIKNGGLVTLVSLDGFVGKPRLFEKPERKKLRLQGWKLLLESVSIQYLAMF